MQKIKVAHVIYNLQRGGAERLTLDICRELNSRIDFETLLIVFDVQNDFAEASEGINIVVCSSKVFLKFPWKIVSDLNDWNALMLKFKPEVIHSHLFYADWVSRESLYEDVAYFSHIHGITTQYESIAPRKWLSRQHAIRIIINRHIKKQYRFCHNQFIANSQVTFRYLVNTLKWDTSGIHLLPNGIDRLKFTRKKNSFSKNIIKLVTTGSLNENKNQAFLILVVMKLQGKGFQVRLDILGDGHLFGDLEKQIKASHLENTVHLHGMVTDVESHLKDGDVYVHTAINESFGLAIAEALAVGLPVVSLDGRGNREIIEDGYNGFMVNSQDATIFADKIADIVKDENTYFEFSNQAFESSKKHDLRQYVDKLELLYKNEMQYRKR
ncbi:MAG: glycosyltransferase [Chitinophagales bacterium]